MGLAILIAVVISAMTVHSLVLHLEDEETRQYPEGVLWRG